MTTIGWLLIIGATLLIRAVIKGQVFDQEGNFSLLQNLGPLFEGLLSGDVKKTEAASDVAGSGTDPVEPVSGPVIDAPGRELMPEKSSTDLLRAAIRRGTHARGYRLGATGPNFYDCSGLVWRALQDSRSFKLPRFTTHVMMLPPWSHSWQQVPSPQVGDIVLWRGHHTGIVSGKDSFYSARNPRSGIGYSSISGWKGQGAPVYLRVK